MHSIPYRIEVKKVRATSLYLIDTHLPPYAFAKLSLDCRIELYSAVAIYGSSSSGSTVLSYQRG
jgi:hypothetical protein